MAIMNTISISFGLHICLLHDDLDYFRCIHRNGATGLNPSNLIDSFM